MIAVAELQTVDHPGPAALLLDAGRRRILGEALEPVSAAELARRVGMGRQRVGYHVRLLARAGLLRKAGRKRRGTFIEQRWQASAKQYALAPQLLGGMGPRPEEVLDRYSAAYLVAVAARSQAEMETVRREAAVGEVMVPALTLDAEVHFENPQQRAAFGEELTRAVLDTVARYTKPGAGRPYRLIAACHPIPSKPKKEGAK